MNAKVLIKQNNRYLKELRSKPTRTEKLVGKYLVERGIYFIFQKGFFKPFHRIADFYLPKRKIIIEVDGKYHNNKLEKDRQKDLGWVLRGIRTIRIKNEDVFSGEYKLSLDEHLQKKLYVDNKLPQCPKNWLYERPQ